MQDRKETTECNCFMNYLKLNLYNFGIKLYCKSWAAYLETGHSLACQVSTAHGLEVDDDVRDLQVSLLLQMSQNTSPEEDLTLTNTEEVRVQLESLDL